MSVNTDHRWLLMLISRSTIVEYIIAIPAGKKYCTSEQECLAIVRATRKLFEAPSHRTHFILKMDHPLEWQPGKVMSAIALQAI